ncbi:hypothetical protein ACLMJK_003727 [Lecanora helva]
MSESPQFSATESSTEVENLHHAQLDGPLDVVLSDMPKRRRLAGDVCAIFVHAGAGYHSLQNEKVHLSACEDAARSAKTFLDNGATAVDAVEIAIKVLEDKEITNAGFGSNLALDGTVECDATIIDQYGRSGAVGAVGCIRNPIHLARLVLEHSTKPLSLHRVPPNLLVGSGATDFAEEVGVPVVLADFLVSAAAGERHARWKKDLDKAAKYEESGSDRESDGEPSKIESEESKCDAQSAELAGVWNESQPISPRVVATEPGRRETTYEVAPPTGNQRRGSYWSSNEPGNDGQSSMKSREEDDESDESLTDDDPPLLRIRTTSRSLRYASSSTAMGSPDPSEDGGCLLPSPLVQPPPTRAATPSLARDPRLDGRSANIDRLTNDPRRQDDITDTVGAIAVDCFGNIAAGSSSGGIGMKHKGRVGPAALVGIGTAVIPTEDDDKDKTSVATVTSGTGELMAGTMAAGVCANRLYSSTRKMKRGESESTDDDTAIRSFVERDFMGHPSVKHSHSSGAIGILGVKKTIHGIALYFAHNTDSFAVASMATDDKEPRSVMSRGKGNGHIVHGARMVKHRRWTSTHRGTWPAASPGDSAGPEPDASSTSKRKRPRVVRNKSSKLTPGAAFTAGASLTSVSSCTNKSQ